MDQRSLQIRSFYSPPDDVWRRLKDKTLWHWKQLTHWPITLTASPAWHWHAPPAVKSVSFPLRCGSAHLRLLNCWVGTLASGLIQQFSLDCLWMCCHDLFGERSSACRLWHALPSLLSEKMERVPREPRHLPSKRLWFNKSVEKRRGVPHLEFLSTLWTVALSYFCPSSFVLTALSQM